MGFDASAVDRRAAELVDAGRITSVCRDNILAWLETVSDAYFLMKTLALLKSEDGDDIEDAFRKKVEFGTGGIRGKMGPGPNRINRRTIGEATQGLAQYVLKAGGSNVKARGVVIAHDTRHNSEAFAEEAACIVAGNGITAYIFSGHRATPELSFAVRKLGAAAGIVISASHNPPSDNGFKVYWSDGGQVVPPHDGNIIGEVTSLTRILREDRKEAEAAGRIRLVSKDMDTHYQSRLCDLSVAEERDLRIVYTPLHGVGTTSIAPVLSRIGFKDVRLVDRQAVPDGNFPTVPGGVANPEVPQALSLAIQEAAACNADIVLASDPDADRLGCALPLSDSGWAAEPEGLCLNGNQIGVVICHFLLQRMQAAGTLPTRGVVAKTIVTTDLTSLVARAFGARVVDNLLVGFKYIAEVIGSLDDDETFLFGTEESHGYLSGDFIRDKDAAAAALLLAECAAYLKASGRSIRQYLDEIYDEFGYFQEVQKSVTRTGAEGSREIQAIMAGLRGSPPKTIGGRPVYEVIDRLNGEARHVETGNIRRVEGAKGNVLAFTFTPEGHTRVTARPSGTEPKIKYYISATSADHPDSADRSLAETKRRVDKLADTILGGMLHAAEAHV